MKLTIADCGWRSIAEGVESNANDQVKLGVDCVASRAMTKMTFHMRPIDPTGKSPKTCPALLTKIFGFPSRANHLHIPLVSPERGAGRDRHERCGEMRWTLMSRRRTWLGADGEVVWS